MTMEFPTIDKFAKEVAEKALDEITYKGKTVREWAEIIVNQHPSEDCISRDDVDAYIAKLMSGYLYDEERTRLEEFSAYLWELPSVTPERPKGKWIYKEYDDRTGMGDSFFCSECGEPRCMKLIKYCPNCGAEMEV